MVHNLACPTLALALLGLLACSSRSPATSPSNLSPQVTGAGGAAAGPPVPAAGTGAAGVMGTPAVAAGAGAMTPTGGNASEPPIVAVDAGGQAADPGAPDAGMPPDDVTDPDAGTDAGAESDASKEQQPDAGPPPTTCTPGAGGMTVNSTIVVPAGQTYDGQCRRYIAGPALGDGSQSESQKPVFRLEDGARLVNVVLGGPAADGIHTYGDVMLSNIVWEDIGEDALTIKASGTVVLDGGAAFNGEDKVFQINAQSTFRVSNFRADRAGKFIRQNGGTTFRVDVFIDRCDISNMNESIFRTDSSVSSVTMTNTRYSRIGKELFMGVNPNNITTSGNTQY